MFKTIARKTASTKTTSLKTAAMKITATLMTCCLAYMAMGQAATGPAGTPATATSPASDKPSLVISDFEAASDLAKWETGDSGDVALTIEPRIASDTNKMLKLSVKGGAYPGISLRKPPKDWGQYEVLSMVVWSAGPVSLGIRVDDDASKNFATRYNGGTSLTAGRTLVQIPIAQIKKSIDPRKVRNLIIFANNAPAGMTLYFDDVRLGPWQTDTVEFIPYKERYDLQPKMDVVTPHIPLARKLAGGPLKAFMLTSVGEGRDAVEMMQRMDYEPSVLNWDRDWGVNTWGEADFYGKRGHNQEFNLMQRYLTSSMQGPEKFEVMLMHFPIGWNRLGDGARAAILKRVKEGTGLVLVMPYPGEEKPWPDDLKELSALIDMQSDFMNPGGEMKQGRGERSTKPWKAVKDHPIMQGCALDAVTVANMRVERYKPAEGAQVLIETTDGYPVVAVKTVGKGQVVTWAVRAESLTPSFARTEQGYRYWETWYQLLNRSAYFAAGRQFARKGDPKPLAVAGEHADAAFAPVQWTDASGKVTDWAMEFKTDGVIRQTLPVTVTPTVNAGEPIKVTFNLPELNAAPANPEAVVSLREHDGQRIRTLSSQKVALANLAKGPSGWSMDLPTNRVGRYAAEAVVEMTFGGKTYRGWATAIVIPAPDWNDYEISFWDGGGLGFMRTFEEQRMREFGATSNTCTPFESTSRALLAGGMRPHYMGVSQGLHFRNVEEAIRQFQATGDKKFLVRTPSLSDPAWLEAEAKRMAPSVKVAAKFKPLTLVCADETSYTYHQTVHDVDWHPANIARYHKFLAVKFGTVEALNAALGTSVKNFEEVQPVTGPEGKKPGNAPLFNEWRSFNEDVWAGHFGWVKEQYAKEYPQTRLSVSGTQAEAIFNAVDWAKLMKHFDAICDYSGRYQLLKRSSFKPDYKSTPWGGYGAVGKSVDHQVWNNLLQNGAGMAIFWWYSIKNPDLTYSKSGQDYQRVFAEIRTGIGRQFMTARPHNDPVAILWSPASQRLAWLDGKMDEFIKTEAQVVDSLRAAGYRPFFITEEEVAAGELKSRGAKAIALPMSLSIGAGNDKGAVAVGPALKAFVAAGGTVVATHKATADEFLKPADMVAAYPFLAPAGKAVPAVLAAAGVKPKVFAMLADGKEAAGTVVYCHDYMGLEKLQAFVVTPIRATRGMKGVVGADGVVHYVASDEGGKEVETLSVDIAGLGGLDKCYDMRRGKKLDVKGYKVTIDVPAGEAMPIVVLPYEVKDIDTKSQRTDEVLTVSWQLKAADKNQTFVPHVVRIDVIDQATGKADTFLSRNADTGADGAGKVEIPMAIEDAGRKLTVKLRDVLTGTTVTANP